MVELDIQKRRNIEKLFKANGINPTDMDITGLFDRSLSYEENVNILKEKFHLFDLSELFQKDEQDFKEAKERIKEIKAYENEEKKTLKQMKKSSVDITEFYGNLPKLLEMINKGFTNSLWVIGGTGVGKTTQINLGLKGRVKRIGGHITAYQLALKLYEFRQGYTLFFDDVEGFLANKQATGILKQALETGERYVNWDSRNSKIPSMFPITSKIVFCVNSVPDNIGMEAILGRSHQAKLDFDYFTILKIMNAIVQKSKTIKDVIISVEERKEIVNFIETNSTPATKDFNLRTQHKIEEFYAFDQFNWKKLALDLLEVDKVLQLILDLAKNPIYPTTKSQQEEWCKQTGKSRASYFLYKRKMR